VNWFRRRYAVTGSDAVIPPCWYRHPVAVEELTALMVSHLGAYTLDEPGSELSACHVQWLWPTLRDLAERAGYKRCTDHKCGLATPLAVEDVNGVQNWVHEDISARDGSSVTENWF
jgi:hypothetical protein